MFFLPPFIHFFPPETPSFLLIYSRVLFTFIYTERSLQQAFITRTFTFISDDVQMVQLAIFQSEPHFSNLTDGMNNVVIPVDKCYSRVQLTMTALDVKFTSQSYNE